MVRTKLDTGICVKTQEKVLSFESYKRCVTMSKNVIFKSHVIFTCSTYMGMFSAEERVMVTQKCKDLERVNMKKSFIKLRKTSMWLKISKIFLKNNYQPSYP